LWIYTKGILERFSWLLKRMFLEKYPVYQEKFYLCANWCPKAARHIKPAITTSFADVNKQNPKEFNWALSEGASGEAEFSS